MVSDWHQASTHLLQITLLREATAGANLVKKMNQHLIWVESGLMERPTTSLNLRLLCVLEHSSASWTNSLVASVQNTPASWGEKWRMTRSCPWYWNAQMDKRQTSVFAAQRELSLHVLFRESEVKYGFRRNTCFTVDAAASYPQGMPVLCYGTQETFHWLWLFWKMSVKRCSPTLLTF